MTFPAEQSFKRDAALTATQRRVYDYLTTLLDFTQVRTVKGQYHSAAMGIHREDFGRALDVLAERGYLVEHQRDVHKVRRFTLAWSVEPMSVKTVTSAVGPNAQPRTILRHGRTNDQR